MKLLRLKANHFRNLTDLNLEPSLHFNLIYGANGSGKTSILEAIYYLSLGRSFRSHVVNRIIAYGEEGFSIFGSIETAENTIIPVGIEKTAQSKTRIKIANQELTTLADLTKTLPVLLINPDSYNLLDSGPKIRRQFLDWGVFHVEHAFFPIWQRFHRALKQRNSALQQNVVQSQVKAWDQELVSNGMGLNTMREQYLQQLIPLIQQILEQLIKFDELTLVFQPGWDTQNELQHQLDASFIRDKQLGYTSLGPQRANIEIKINKMPVQDVLSRGEQKLLIFAMLLAQGLLLQQQTGKNCVYLLDDIAAELDAQRWQKIKQVLIELQAQVFITATDVGFFAELQETVLHKLFHVEHGSVRQIAFESPVAANI